MPWERPDPAGARCCEQVCEVLLGALPAGGTGKHDHVQLKLDVFSLEDDYVSASLTALGRALDTRAAGLYAGAGAESVLAPMAHCLLANLAERALISRDPRALSERELKKVLQYMHERIGDDVDPDRLAGLVNLSKYHFLRMFTKATGVTAPLSRQSAAATRCRAATHQPGLERPADRRDLWLPEPQPVRGVLPATLRSAADAVQR